MKKDLAAILPAITASTDQIVNRLVETLAQTALANNTVTYGGLQDVMSASLSNVLESTGLMDMAKRFKAGTLEQVPPVQPNPALPAHDDTPRDEDGL